MQNATRNNTLRTQDMKHTIRRIWIRNGLETKPEVAALLGANPQVAANGFGSVAQVVVPGNTMAEKIENGKRVLVIDRRSGSLLDEFVNHDTGSICPNFPKLLPGTNCPYACHYCFLAGTYRACRPFVCAYVVDFEKLTRDLTKRHGNRGSLTVVSAGEMSDPLAGDFLGYMPRIVELFGAIDKLKLLILTKSGIDEIQPLLTANHNGHVITAWSITCNEVVERYEQRTEAIHSRVAAAKAAQDAGYEVRFRLDPFLLFEDWEKAYARTIDHVYAMGIQPARFTLGSFRLLGNLGSIIKARFPHSDLVSQPLVNDGGKRKRYPHETREQFYRHAIAQIRQRDADIPIALCKETTEIHQALEGETDATKCNCLP